jgi:ribonuclease HI
MTIDNSFIQLISHKDTLNKEQFKILALEYPPLDNWKELALNKEVSKNDGNLLMLLKGDLSLKAQEQIIKNYHMILEFNNIKAKSVYEAPKNQETDSSKAEEKDDDKEEHIRIYCDGACSGNPGEAGSGLAIYSNKKNPVLLHGAYEKDGTNNIAELNALYQALIIARQSNSQNIITIYSDSKYSIDCITTWAYGWKAKGWTKKGGEIKNLELIKEAHQLYERLKNKIEIHHVKGHSGVEGNELADRMAVHTIKAKNKDFAFYSYNKIEDVLSLTSY